MWLFEGGVSFKWIGADRVMFSSFLFRIRFFVIKGYKIFSFAPVVMRERNRGSGIRNDKYGKLYID